VTCQACHAGQVYKGTPRTCASCHAEPASHKGTFGTDCARCHTTSTWAGATFRHTFPLHHGRGKRESSTCATCHATANDFRTYTCYGCHKHQPAGIERKHRNLRRAELQNCVRCHPTGREHEKREKEPEGDSE
jgi:hypothetical protein